MALRTQPDKSLANKGLPSPFRFDVRGSGSLVASMALLPTIQR